MALIVTQDSIDYINAASKRVAAETELLKRRVTTSITAGTTSQTLADEVVRVVAVYIGDTRLELIGNVDYLRFLSLSQTAATDAPAASYTVIGRTLYFWPQLAAGDSLTLIYSYRPADINSASTFELTGQAERLIERLAAAYFLMDDGQPELGQQELIGYTQDASRLRRRDGRREGGGGQLSLAGHRRRSI